LGGIDDLSNQEAQCKRLSAPPFVMEQISSFSLFLTRMNGENIEALARAY
jgi:hypothetical protein